jgi:competence protein ComEC
VTRSGAPASRPPGAAAIRAAPGAAAVRTRPDVRLVPAAAVAWLCGWWAVGSGVVLAAAGAGACAVLAAVALRLAAGSCPRGRVRGGWARRALGHQAALALAAGSAVLACAAGTAAQRSAGPFPAWVADRAVADLTGSLTGDPRPVAAGRWSGQARYVVRLQATQVRARGHTRRVDAPVLVLGGAAWSRLSAGAEVVVTGRLSPPGPGDDVVAMVSALGGPARAQPGAWWWRAADRVRAGLRTAVVGLPAEPGGLLPSLVLGDTSTLQPQVTRNLTTAGLTHLTAVSGANVAIVLGSILWVAAVAGVTRRSRIALAGLGLAGFVVLARPEPSVLRAAAMGVVALVGLTAGRRPRGVPALCAAVVTLLVADPWLARSPGFALSSVATGALLLLAPPWASRLERWMPRPLALALAAPTAAQAACGPIVVLLNPSVSLAAVPANLLAEPAVAPATVLGVVCAVLSLVWPWGAHVVAAVSCCATWWITTVADRAAAVPGASVPWLPGIAGAAALATLTALAVVVSLRVAPAVSPRQGPWVRSAEPGGRPNPTAAAGLAGLLLAALLAGWLLAPLLAGRLPVQIGRRSGWPPPGWVIAMCDVGQGDATVMRSGADRAVLVDAGPEPSAVDGCLSRLGVRHLDLVVLTHFHADHVLGLNGALHDRDAQAVLVSPLAQPGENAQAVHRWATARAVPERVAWTGMSGEVGADGWQLRWRVLLPDDSTVPKAAPYSGSGIGRSDEGPGDGSTVNGSSVATLVEVRAPDGSTLRLAGLGDLEEPGQQRLVSVLAAGADPHVDVVKVAHHGSAKQDGELYRLLSPRIGLIGVGTGNDYGHPTASALDLLARLGVEVRRTDLSGDVAVGGGNDLVIWTRS